jgi:hypothetical protein
VSLKRAGEFPWFEGRATGTRSRDAEGATAPESLRPMDRAGL